MLIYLSILFVIELSKQWQQFITDTNTDKHFQSEIYKIDAFDMKRKKGRHTQWLL